MIARIRQWWRRHVARPEREPPAVIEELRTARAYGIEQQRESHRRVRALREEYDVNLIYDRVRPRREMRP